MNCYCKPCDLLASQFSFYVNWRRVMWWWVVVGLAQFCFCKVCGKEGDPSFDCLHIKTRSAWCLLFSALTLRWNSVPWEKSKLTSCFISLYTKNLLPVLVVLYLSLCPRSILHLYLCCSVPWKADFYGLHYFGSLVLLLLVASGWRRYL